MIKKEDKKGSHVGIMISFVIFVTFLIFVYAIIQPTITSQKDKESVLDFLELGVTDKISSDMTTGTVHLINSVNQNCIELDGIITALGIGDNIAVRNYLGNYLNSYLSSSDSNDLKIQRASTSDNLLKISYSEAFGEIGPSSLSCVRLTKGSGYNLGLTKTQKYIFETKMTELIEEYSNYNTLKSELNLPEGVDFGYGIILTNGTEIYTNEEEPSTNIYIKETPIFYVDRDGNIQMGYLKTKIW
ncbi:MAG: hypothetical protein ABIE36_02235 [Candidatus Diapherotrites archaeon]